NGLGVQGIHVGLAARRAAGRIPERQHRGYKGPCGGDPVDRREWEACGSLHEAFEAVGRGVSDRSRLLFGLACCQRIPPATCPPAGLRSLEVASRYAEGLAAPEEMDEASQAAFEAHVVESERPSVPLAGEIPWRRHAEMASRALSLLGCPGLY